MVTIIMQGGMVDLHESERFNKVRHRLNDAKKELLDYQSDNFFKDDEEKKFEPFHILSFKTVDNGRVSVSLDAIKGIISDEPTDQ